MLNIVIYDEDSLYINKNIDIINRLLGDYNGDYRIHKFSGFNEEFNEIIYDKNGFKIYILDIDNKDTLGLKIAKEIRLNEIDSIIIFVSKNQRNYELLLDDNLIAFDFICKGVNYEMKLSKVIGEAISLYSRNRTFSFSYNHVIYRIPYCEINYIEKEPLIKRCIIHTINNNYYVVNSIENLKNILGIGFIKTHQSCIVNVKNIKEVLLNDNLIIFRNNDKTHLLTDKMKRVVKECIKID